MTALSETLRLTDFTTDHLPGAVRLSQQAGWPHRSEDWALTLSHSRGVVACDGDDVVGTALVSVFGDVATLSMIIVDARMRGQRVGRRLMTAVIEAAGPREMRLIATADGLPLYEKLGFEVTGTIQQFQGIATAADPGIAVETGALDPQRMAEMDTLASGLQRERLLAQIAGAGQVLHTEDGFAVLRDFGRGQVLGPIVARDTATAQALLAAAARACAGTFLRIDTPQPEMAPIATAMGLTHVGGGTTMVRQARTPASAQTFQTYGLVSQALG